MGKRLAAEALDVYGLETRRTRGGFTMKFDAVARPGLRRRVVIFRFPLWWDGEITRQVINVRGGKK